MIPTDPRRLTAPDLAPLRDYAVVADGRRGALIGPGGECLWFCFPGWADEPVFAHLVGGGGCYTVRPTGRVVWAGHYETGGLIWRGTWAACGGALECRDALTAPAETGRAVLLRQIRCTDGAVDVEVALAPVSGMESGSPPVTWHRSGGAWSADLGRAQLRWTGVPDATVVMVDGVETLAATVSLRRGDVVDLVLDLTIGPVTPLPPVAELWRRTEAWWQASVPDQPDSAAPRDARHAAAVLRGLTNPDGATVAAVTTSLPERAHRGPAFDYRYAWSRDVTYVGHAAASVGWEELAVQTINWTASRLLEDGAGLLPAYTADGRAVPAPRDLSLPGYPGSEVTVGNQVLGQFQLDAFGEALILFADGADLGLLATEHVEAAEVAARTIAARWKEPEAGIWELEYREWTHSRLICAAGLRRMAVHHPDHAAQWRSLADDMVADMRRRAVHPSGRWQRAPDDPRVDASLLLGQIRRAVDAEDPLSEATRRAVARDLGSEHLLYRFQHEGEERPGEHEGAFLLCNFWMALACHQVGEHVEAARWFERGRSSCGTPGLFSEEWDVLSRQLRGNLPQSFVHAIFLESAGEIGRS
jgi:hypothetical protein